MVKPLAFKGDKKPKKRKIASLENSLTLQDGDVKDISVQNTTAEGEEDDSCTYTWNYSSQLRTGI